MATKQSITFTKTDQSNICIAFNGKANTKTISFDFTLPDDVGKITNVYFQHYHTMNGVRTGIKFRCALVGKNGIVYSTSSQGWNLVTDTFENVDIDILRNFDSIIIENSAWDSSSADLYYQATTNHPSFLTIEYYPLSELLPSAPTLTLSTSAPSGCNPIVGFHNLYGRWTEPSSWGGDGSEELTTKIYNYTLTNLTTNEIFSSSQTEYNNLGWVPSGGTKFSISVNAQNDYGTSETVSETIDYYNISATSVPSYSGKIIENNPLTNLSGVSLEYNSTLDANLSIEKNFIFNLGKLTGGYSITNQGYDYKVKLNYTINNGDTQATNELNTDGAQDFSADQYNDTYNFTGLTVIVHAKTTYGTEKDYSFDFPLSDLKVQIGTNTILTPTYTLISYTKDGIQYNYDCNIKIDIAEKLDSITKVKLGIELGSGTYSKTLTLNSNSATLNFKNDFGVKNYSGKQLKSITYLLLDDFGTAQIFRFKTEVEPVFSKKDTSTTPTFISKWDTPTITMTGDLGANKYYNTAQFNWTLPSEMSALDIAVKINGNTVAKNTSYSYSSSVLNGISEGDTQGTLTVSFTDQTYGFSINSTTITEISRAKRAKINSTSAPSSMYKYSSWSDSGELVENVQSFKLTTANITLSNLSLTYTLDLSTTDVNIGATSATATSNSYLGAFTSSGLTLYLRAKDAATGAKTISYTLKVYTGSTLLDTISYSSTLQVNDGNLPPYDNGTISCELSNYFYCNGKYYLIPNLSTVKVSGVSNGVKVQPTTAAQARMSLKAGTNTIQSAQTTSATTDLTFPTPYSLTESLASEIITLNKAFTANSQTISNDINVKANSNNVLIGWFTNAISSFQSVPASFSGKNLTVNFNSSSKLNSDIRTTIAGTTTSLVNNFTIKVFGAQTQTTETYTISNQSFTTSEQQSHSFTVTLSDNFFDSNGSFTISIIPSIAGQVNNTGDLVTFYTGSESASTTIITDSPDFTIRKHRIAVNRAPSTGADLSCLEIQIPTEVNYNHYISFYDDTGAILATFDVNEKGVIISGGSW
jgi:hypothetical protein